MAKNKPTKRKKSTRRPAKPLATRTSEQTFNNRAARANSEPKFAQPTSENAKPTRAVTPPEALNRTVAKNRLAILQSPSYQLAELDIDFLKRKENRPLRMQLELLKTETLLRE